MEGGWYVNRALEGSGLIPQGMLALDDLVRSGSHDQLVNALVAILKDGVGGYDGRSESQEDLSLEVQQWTNSEIANLLWSLLKSEPEEVQWRYIPRRE